MESEKYGLIRSGLVLVDFGPVTMTLEAYRDAVPSSCDALAGAEKVVSVFDDLVSHYDIIRSFIKDAQKINQVPSIVSKMISSVSMLGENDFTPMASVAGSVADAAADAMMQNGADYSIANNGGDIAFRTLRKRDIRVGLISDIQTGKITHKLKINSDSEIRGIATSGLGGRSLTRGVASSVTALAHSASYADAAATSIANACFCIDPAVERCFAEELDYDTDIKGLLVTRSVGNLRRESIQEALRNGAKRANELVSVGLIIGAVIFVSGESLCVGSDKDFCVEGMRLHR